MAAILDALEREALAALDDARIYNIDSYGWLNEYDPDPEFIGHAMWQLDQPSIDCDALLGERPVQRRPEEVEGLVLAAGEDFCGVMRAARLSIGLALLWHRQARAAPLNDEPFFWLHHMDAFLELAIASQRLRDLLVVACTGDSEQSYKKAPNRNRRYATPFEDAQRLLSDRGVEDSRVADALEVLPDFGRAIFEYVDRRNAIVHEVATRMAKFKRDSVRKLQQRFDQEQGGRRCSGSENPDDPTDEARRRLQSAETESDRAIKDLRTWYELLIRTSNCVFQIEYWSRALCH